MRWWWGGGGTNNSEQYVHTCTNLCVQSWETINKIVSFTIVSGTRQPFFFTPQNRNRKTLFHRPGHVQRKLLHCSMERCKVTLHRSILALLYTVYMARWCDQWPGAFAAFLAWGMCLALPFVKYNTIHSDPATQQEIPWIRSRDCWLWIHIHIAMARSRWASASAFYKRTYTVLANVDKMLMKTTQWQPGKTDDKEDNARTNRVNAMTSTTLQWGA